jgi:hypothetical protein
MAISLSFRHPSNRVIERTADFPLLYWLGETPDPREIA